MTINPEFEKLKSEYPDIFAKFPSELIEFIFSERTSSIIAEICLENEIEEEEKLEKIAYRITLALLGQAPKENLTEILEEGAGLSFLTAEKISIAAGERLFSQLLEPQSAEPSPVKQETILSAETESETESKEKIKDTYRETVE